MLTNDGFLSLSRFQGDYVPGFRHRFAELRGASIAPRIHHMAAAVVGRRGVNTLATEGGLPRLGRVLATSLDGVVKTLLSKIRELSSMSLSS